MNGEVVGRQGGGGLPNNNTQNVINRQPHSTNKHALTRESESETIIPTNNISSQEQSA